MTVRKTLFAVAFVTTLSCSIAVHAALIKGVHFDDTIVAGNTRLFLKGTGLSRYLIVLKGYVGALYLPHGVESREALEDVSKHLVLEYFHAIKAEQFGSATKTLIKKMLPRESLNGFSPKSTSWLPLTGMLSRKIDMR